MSVVAVLGKRRGGRESEHEYPHEGLLHFGRVAAGYGCEFLDTKNFT